MMRRLAPWLVAVACAVGAHASAWGQNSVSLDPSAPFAAVGRTAAADVPAARLVQRSLDGVRRHVIAKFAIPTAALAVLAFATWFALHGEPRAAMSTGRRGRAFNRGPPARATSF